MHRSWAQYWINLFKEGTDELMKLYSPQFLFEDVNFGLRIENDKNALRQFFDNFQNTDESVSYNKFDVFDYVGDDRLGHFQWTWETKHASDFLGVPAAGKVTKTRGMTTMGWNSDGLIILERSIWDAVAVYGQLGAVPPVEH
ncbi:ester cyclase [Croceicoccus mobilis]|uniref:SnoaL-like domain-containing protein n=1 Tax=Croceicoccus mobilis TaxID=1703339 RepID=A0A916Z8F4_9SPHN|nr:ester cyclase [Croceicoccus mobilis]GGD81370.1 hypothetical protein GCM10010990_34150 [Croceicoccus mobilis]